MAEELYAILGVPRGATEAEIKKAYRRLARELHPDRNKGNKESEERFKKVSAAYAVLGNPEKRGLYDKYGVDGLRDGFDPAVWERARQYGGRAAAGGGAHGEQFDFGGFSGFGGMESIFETLFGQAARGGRGAPRREWRGGSRRRGFEVRSQMEVELLDTVLGRELQIEVPVEGEMRRLTVKLPKGIESGQSIRLRGQGGAGGRGGDAGDLIIEVKVKEDEIFTRKGMDLVKREDVPASVAYFGGALSVETPWGSGKVTVPPGTRGGKKVRIKGHGVRRGDEAGDLYVQLNVVLPSRRDAEAEAVMRRLEELER